MKECVSRFVMAKKIAKNNRIYYSPRIYLPTNLVNDSSFPFREKILKIHVKVKGKQLILKKASRSILEKFGESLSEETD